MMKPRVNSISILILMGFIFQLLMTPVYAANPCALPHLDGLSEGIGGTGKKPVRQEGLGGTGRSDWRDGIGGTGHSEGMGGTGMPVLSGNVTVVGVVTGFASICVNGLEIYFDQNTRIAIDGKPSDISILRVGQVVTVEAQQFAGRLSAIEMDVRYEAVGQVSAIDRVNGVAEIMGHRLKVSERAAGLHLSQLSRGDTVRVSGLRGPLGEIIVTRLEQQGEVVSPYERRVQAVELVDGLASVQGIVEKVDAEGIRLVDWPNIVLDGKSSGGEMNVESGDLVHVVIDNREGRPDIIDLDVLEHEELYERAGYEVIDFEKPVEKARPI